MKRYFEKDRSAVAMVTGKVRNRSRADTTSVNVEVRAALSTIEVPQSLVGQFLT